MMWGWISTIAEVMSVSVRVYVPASPPMSVTACFQALIEARIDASRIALEDPVAILIRQRRTRIDIALRIVEVLPRCRILAPHRADHLRSEQHVAGRDNLGQQLDARFVIDTRVEEDVVQQPFERAVAHFERHA